MKTQKKIFFSSRGLDFDAFLPEPNNGRDIIPQIKALVNFSRKINAVSVVLLVRDGGAYLADISIGLTEHSKELFAFSQTHELVKEHLASRQIVVFNRPASDVAELHNKFATEDLKYINRALFLPAVYNKQDAICFIAFSAEKNIALTQIIEQLNIYSKEENSEIYAV